MGLKPWKPNSILVLSIMMSQVSGFAAENPGDDSLASNPRIVDAPRAETPPLIDGVFTDEIWKTAPAYTMCALPADDPEATLADGGTVRFAWDDDWFYMAADFVDRDVVAFGSGDGELHYEKGDLVELFLHYAADTYYWEMYGTPSSHQSTLFFWSGGSMIVRDRALQKESLLRVAAKVRGTLNDSTDADQGYSVEMAVPASMLRRHGAEWKAGILWRVLAARYNYGRNLKATEYSAHVPLSRINFHLLAEYAHLRLMP